MFSKDVLLPTMSTKGEKDLKKSIKEANRKSVDKKGSDARKKVKSVAAVGSKKVNLNKTISNQNLFKKKINSSRSNSQNLVAATSQTRP